MRAPARLARPLAAGAAVALIVPAAIAFAPAASAATTDTGDSTSTATVLSLTALGHTAQAIKAQLAASTIKHPSSALVDLVPVTLDGTAYFEQKVSSGSQSVASKSINAVGNAVAVTTPAVSLTASTANGPVAKLTSTGGTFSSKLLGLVMPDFTGNLDFGSSVVNKTSDASKTVDIKGFALPALDDLLGALGLDLGKVDVAHLKNLVDQLNLNVSSAIQTAETAYNTAKTAVTTATAQVATATTALNTAVSAADFTPAPVQTVLTTLGISAPTNAAEWHALTNAQKTALSAALGSAGTAINTADAALTTAETALNTALAALASASATLMPLLLGVLNVPLVSIGELKVGTIADAGGKHVAQVTGSVKGLSVLGNQLIKSTDVVSLASSVLATVTSQINALTSAVSTALTGGILSGVLGTLKVPAPKISVLQKTTSLNPAAGYQAATAAVVGAAVSWGALSIPTTAIPSVAGPNAAHPHAAIVNGNLVTDPIAVTVADLSEASRYAPATATTPSSTPTTTSNPGLAATGVSTGVAVGALLFVLAAYGVRRFRAGLVANE